jgi:GH25 family lysozyme M1 (1,4-beta-N-acetylmuramidase)
MKKIITFFALLAIWGFGANAQTCATSGFCTSSSETNQYPASTFSTTSSSWTTVSAYMNAGNWTLFDVTSGDTYEWTYCSNYGGLQEWDAELTLFDNSDQSPLCYANNCGLTGCPNAPYIRWTATFTGVVRLLTTVSGCTTNTGSPYSTLVWRDASGSASTTILGIDVSNWQGTINWTEVAGDGVIFAWAKATEGLSVTDAYYLDNAQNGVAAGVYMGAYHFAHPDDNPTVADAADEANYFLSLAQPYIISCELPPALDYETDVSGSMTSADQEAWIESWMNTVKTATGITPILYTDGSIANEQESSLASYCNIWTADPDGSATSAPSSTYLGPWYPNWSFKQYSDAVPVNGISASGVDGDSYNGSLAELKTLMGCSTVGIPVKVEDNNFIIYPIPARDNITIENSVLNNNKNEEVLIYNLQGQLMYQQAMPENKINVDVSNFTNGMYFVKMRSQKGVMVKKFVKE